MLELAAMYALVTSDRWDWHVRRSGRVSEGFYPLTPGPEVVKLDEASGSDLQAAGS